MTNRDLAAALGLEILNDGDLDRSVSGCYIGDLLSWVMGRAQSGDVWLTIMGNINAIAVAVLADTACICLCEGAALDDEALQKAKEQQVTVLRSGENSYRLAVKLSTMI